MEFKRTRYGAGIDDISDSKGREEEDSDMHLSNVNRSFTDEEINSEIDDKIEIIEKLLRGKTIRV